MDAASKKHLQPGGIQSKGAFGSVKSLKDGSSSSSTTGGGYDLTDSRPPQNHPPKPYSGLFHTH